MPCLRQNFSGFVEAALCLEALCLRPERGPVAGRNLKDMIKDRPCFVETTEGPECISKGQKDADVARIQLCSRLIMFLRNVNLPEPSFQMSHLLEHESTVRQTPECFFIRPERAFEVAQNAVAINALREPCFPELGLERHRPICSFLHRGAAVCLRINAIEIELAARDRQTGPCEGKLRI